MRVLRTYVYVDGLNLYFRALRHTPWKWLDLYALCEQALKPRHRILKIKYFTSRVLPAPEDPFKFQRQDVYLRALREYRPKETEFYFGHFLRKRAKFPLADPAENGRIVDVLRAEEKGSDVNLAVHLVSDAWEDLYDCAVLVSNDSDMLEGMRLTKEKHPKKLLGLISPARKFHSRPLRAQADFFIRLRPSNLRAAQLPNPIPGTNLRKPSRW